MAVLCKPLYDLLQKGVEWNWGVKQEEAFNVLKSKMISAPVLGIYNRNLPVKLDCDASYYGIGAVLSHAYPNGDEKPVAFASRTLNENEQNYSQLDKEALAIIFAVKKFNQFLYGRRFTLRCDNKALCRIFGDKFSTPVLAASRLVRWFIILSSYDYEIEFRATGRHLNADMLSRLPLKDSSSISVFKVLYETQVGHLPVDAEHVRVETLHDVNLKLVLSCLQNNSWHHNKAKVDSRYYTKRTELSLEDGVIFWGIRVVLPESLRKPVLTELHYQHPGIVRMKSLARMHVWYPHIDKDIEELVSTCPRCRSVANEPPKSRQHPWAWPNGPMDRIHFDFFGPFHNKTFLVMVDSFSKGCEVVIMNSSTRISLIDECRNIFSRYGIPNHVVTDNGRQFTSDDFERFCKGNGINHILTAPYHQSSNGQAERFVQTIKRGLKLNDITIGCTQRKLDNYLFAYRLTPSCVTAKLF